MAWLQHDWHLCGAQEQCLFEEHDSGLGINTETEMLHSAMLLELFERSHYKKNAELDAWRIDR